MLFHFFYASKLMLIARWDGDEASLSATLYQARPDVFPVSGASPIPSEMPEQAYAAVFNQ
jgi:hypothetical protein